MEQRPNTAWEHSSTASWNSSLTQQANKASGNSSLKQPASIAARHQEKSGLTQPASIAARHHGTAADFPHDEDLYQPSEMIATAEREQQASIAARHQGTATYYSMGA